MKAEKGSALIISLIILLIISMIGVQGMQSTTMEEKMSGNYRDRAVAFEAAEAALQAGEIWLNLLAEQPVAIDSGTNSNAVWDAGSLDLSENTTWTNSGIEANTGLTEGSGALASTPQFIIEERKTDAVTQRDAEQGALGTNSVAPYAVQYRITARGVGTKPTTVVMLQANYEKIYTP